MYDVEMMRMLNLIHMENKYIFELIKTALLSRDIQEMITFDDYDKEYKRIMKDTEKHSPCLDCSYKNRYERFKDIIKEKPEDEVKE